LEVAELAPADRLALVGRHGCARYQLAFELTDAADGATHLRAITHAEIPAFAVVSTAPWSSGCGCTSSPRSTSCGRSAAVPDRSLVPSLPVAHDREPAGPATPPP